MASSSSKIGNTSTESLNSQEPTSRHDSSKSSFPPKRRQSKFCLLRLLNVVFYRLQHGFRSGWSCETQLLELTATLHSNLAARKQTDLIILDFSKAFDKVCHVKLLSKFDYYGVRGDVFNWIKDFLANRKQSVVVDGEQLSNLPVLSGVPQGSAIGPALFIICISDLPEYVKSDVHLFANDTAILLTIDSTEHCLQLQSDLKSLGNWENDWLMEFNPEKCEVPESALRKLQFFMITSYMKLS